MNNGCKINSIFLVERIKKVFNVRSNYDARQMGIDIKGYYEAFVDAREVIVLKGKKMISIKRNMALSKQFPMKFRRMYEK